MAGFVSVGSRKARPVLGGLFLLAWGGVTGSYLFDYKAPLPHGDWIAENLSRIAVVDPDNFSFAVLGDSRSYWPKLAYLLDSIRSADDTAFTVNLGDLVNRQEVSEFRSFFRVVRKAEGGRPHLIVKGNHDASPEGLYERFVGPSYYSFAVGGVYFVVLDDADTRGIDSGQWRWLTQELRKSQEYPARLVFMHVPLFDPRKGNHRHCLHPDQAERLLKLFREYRVSHIFASHIHGYFAGTWDGIPYTISGGGGGSLVKDSEKHSFHHFLKVYVRKGIVSVRPFGLEWSGNVPEFLGNSWMILCGIVVLYGDLIFLVFSGAIAAFILFAALPGPKTRLASWNIRSKTAE